MSEKFTRFTVASTQEEFDCPTCGWPVHTGDTAYVVQSDTLECEYVTCSRSCHASEVRECERVMDDLAWTSYEAWPQSSPWE